MNAHKSENPAATGLNADQITNTQILPPAERIGKLEAVVNPEPVTDSAKS